MDKEAQTTPCSRKKWIDTAKKDFERAKASICQMNLEAIGNMTEMDERAKCEHLQKR